MLIVEEKAKIEALFIFLQVAVILAIRKFLFQSLETSGVWEWLLFSLVFFALLPWITLRYMFRQKIGQYNLNLRFYKQLNFPTILTLVLLLAGLAGIVVTLDWKSTLPVFFWVQGGFWLTLFIDLCFLSLVVLSQEFFFRGYWHETLRKAWGMKAAVIGSALFAFGYAVLTLADVSLQKIGYLLFLHLGLSLLVAYNRSILLTFFVHWAWLLFIDLLAVYNIFR